MYIKSEPKNKLAITSCVFKKGRVLFTTHDYEINKLENLNYSMHDFVDFLEWCVRNKKYLRIDDERVRGLMLRVEAEVKAHQELRKEMLSLSRVDIREDELRVFLKNMGFTRVEDVLDYETYLRANVDLYLDFSKKVYSSRDNVANTYIRIPNDITDTLKSEGFLPTLIYKNVMGGKT